MICPGDRGPNRPGEREKAAALHHLASELPRQRRGLDLELTARD